MTSVALKPSCQRVLARLRHGPATTHDLMQADVGGVRFGARLRELREAGFTIAEQRLPLPTRGSRYELTHDVDLGRPVSETQSPAMREQADPGLVPSTEGVRSAPAVQASEGALFDASTFQDRGSFRDAA